MKQLMTENLPFEDAPFRRSQICLPRTETADTEMEKLREMRGLCTVLTRYILNKNMLHIC